MKERNLLLLFLCALLPLVTSCARRASGTIFFGSNVIHESEPNNHASNPDSIGGIWVGSEYLIEGSVVENQSAFEYGPPLGADYFDGFAFVVEEPSEVEFFLTAHNPHADLDIWIYDPFYNEYIATFESIFDPEVGTVTFPYVGEEFHVVVSSYAGNSSYRLEVAAYPLNGYYGPAQSADSAESSKGSERMAPYRRAEPEPDPEPERVTLRRGSIVTIDEAGNARVLPFFHDERGNVLFVHEG